LGKKLIKHFQNKQTKTDWGYGSRTAASQAQSPESKPQSQKKKKKKKTLKFHLIPIRIAIIKNTIRMMEWLKW
jgi:hypothetical protein